MKAMGRPPTAVLVCEDLHSFLLVKGVPPGEPIPRNLWDELVMKAAGVGYVQSRNLTATGAGHGLWVRHGNHGRAPSYIVLQPAEEECATL